MIDNQKSKVVLMAVGLVCMVLGSGCTVFQRGQQFTPPAGFEQDPRAQALLDPGTRAQTWGQLVPDPPKLQFSAEMAARGSWWKGSERFSALYFSFRPGQGNPALRLRGFQKEVGQTLFEVIVQNGDMTVLLPVQAQGFRGPVPPAGSPFMRRYGVEPWQLDQVFLIGRSLATQRFSQIDAGQGPVVTAAEGATSVTPQRVELDAATGLPRRAQWVAGNQRYEVRYLAWDWFSNRGPAESAPATASSQPDSAGAVPGEQQLMPRLLEIRRDEPHTILRLEVSHYQFGALVPPRIFELITENPVLFEPLERLDRVLAGS